MQLHAVKSGDHGILGRLGVVGNDLANFRQRQFARRFIFLHALRGEMLRAFDFDGRRRHGQLAAAIHGMAHAASVPELGENDSAFFMHGLRDFAPGGNLFFFKQAGVSGLPNALAEILMASDKIRPALARWA